jgi:hypothetical protein
MDNFDQLVVGVETRNNNFNLEKEVKHDLEERKKVIPPKSTKDFIVPTSYTIDPNTCYTIDVGGKPSLYGNGKVFSPISHK